MSRRDFHPSAVTAPLDEGAALVELLLREGEPPLRKERGRIEPLVGLPAI
jgi:hypothetical protein